MKNRLYTPSVLMYYNAWLEKMSLKKLYNGNNGAWLSLVEHCVRDAGVAGSNPVAPIQT